MLTADDVIYLCRLHGQRCKVLGLQAERPIAERSQLCDQTCAEAELGGTRCTDRCALQEWRKSAVAAGVEGSKP